MNPKEISTEHLQLIKEYGVKIKELRIKKGISYIDMAEEIGISRNTYNLIELGKVNFKITTLISILNYHQISLTDFFKEIPIEEN